MRDLWPQVTTMLGQQLSKEEVDEFMKEADVDGNGKLDYDEFVKMLMSYWALGRLQNVPQKNRNSIFVRI